MQIKLWVISEIVRQDDKINRGKAISLFILIGSVSRVKLCNAVVLPWYGKFRCASSNSGRSSKQTYCKV